MNTTTFLSLCLASLIAAPVPKKGDPNNWIGEIVIIKKSGTPAMRIDAEGKQTPAGYVRSVESKVLDQKEGKLLIRDRDQEVWVNQDDMVLLNKAADYFAERIKETPDVTYLHAFRGWANHRTGKSEEALKDYSQAIRLSPQSSDWYNNRALIYSQMQKYKEAIEDYSKAIELRPNNPLYFRNRSRVHRATGEHEKAISDLKSALKLDPDHQVTLNDLAWTLATSPIDKIRDKKLAVEYAERVCQLTDYKNGVYLDTLAAAYAENDEFDKAVEYQKKAMQAVNSPVNNKDAEKRLELYQNKKPYREEMK
ncbi:MAG: tetratricopeptide repeat protein [Gemmataceae bacterium]|jgi:tetratricopeptide (TPR) repeat protein|nr:tetratricopeptide repeat protein [Gemmataceae bacterium]